MKVDVQFSGNARIFTRMADSGFAIRMSFCPECGSTVYWETDKYPDRCGIAVGCFADPTFPPPTMSMWEDSKHPWLGLPDGMRHLELGLQANGQPMRRCDPAQEVLDKAQVGADRGVGTVRP
jgi:hypothetical protein